MNLLFISAKYVIYFNIIIRNIMERVDLSDRFLFFTILLFGSLSKKRRGQIPEYNAYKSLSQIKS